MSLIISKNSQPKYRPKIFVVDKDSDAAAAVIEIADAHRLRTQHFATGEELLAAVDEGDSGCVVMEVGLPGIGGFQLLNRLATAKICWPVVMVAVNASVADAVRAMKGGAADFFCKPVQPLELWAAIQMAIEKNTILRSQRQELETIRLRMAQLTDDEYLVMKAVLLGKPNKSIAAELDLSCRSIDFRRARVLRKMQVRSLVELSQMLVRMEFNPHFAVSHSNNGHAAVIHGSRAHH